MPSRRHPTEPGQLPDDIRRAVLEAFRSGRTDADVAAALDRVPLPERYKVHAAILLLRRDLAAELLSVPATIAAVRRVEASNAAVIYDVHWNDQLIPGTSTLVRLAHQGGEAATLTSVTTGSVWREGFDRIFSWICSAAYAPFLRQPDLRAIFENMQRSLPQNLRVRLTRVSSLRRLLHTPSRRRYESGLTWTDIDAEEAFMEAAESSTYFRSASFELCKAEARGQFTSTDVVGRVSRDAHFSASAKISWLFSAAVKPALARALQQGEITHRRGRMTMRDPTPHAILARFDAVSLRRGDLPRIADRLRKMPAASVSILHGNPYLHAAVVDMNDGSAFDLLVASEKQLLIIPQLRATEPAVVRICRYIYDQVGEAEFVDAGRELGSQ